ncbi:MAG: hypothetical protein K9M57_08165, partial [Phycisphaerae bacterium]|nr:hypothetical protein [Phycisphaerae bacterium]
TSWRSRHEPVRDCTRCHVDGMRWDRKQFKRPLPQLCYECHTNYGLATGHLHGPVAVGACLYCHEPHQSKYPNLLRVQPPQLCYQCHQESDILSLASHQKIDPTRCNTCHDPHISPLRKLLKIHADDAKPVNSSSPDKLEGSQ